MTVDDGPAAAAAPGDFSATTSLLVGVFLDLVTAGRHSTAEAWLRSHSGFRNDGRHVELVITPKSEEDSIDLEEASGFLESSIGRYSGYVPSDVRSVLKFRLEPHAHHPAAHRRKQLQALARAASGLATEDEDAETIRRFCDLVERSDLGVARYATQEYELFGLDNVDHERDATMALVDEAEKSLHKLRKSLPSSVHRDGPNNWSPPVQALTVRSLLHPAEVVRSQTAEATRGLPIVGVITSGGEAAPGDVAHKLQRDHRVHVRHERVILQYGNVSRQILRAFDRLRDADPVAYVIGFGGGSAETLHAIVDGLEEYLAAITTPTYVGIGHRNFSRKGGSGAVRWCLTPSGAVDLFLAESVELPFRRATVYERAARDMREGIGSAVASEVAIAKLRKDLAAITESLRTMRALHLQPESTDAVRAPRPSRAPSAVVRAGSAAAQPANR